jgi:hypothetical protein
MPTTYLMIDPVWPSYREKKRRTKQKLCCCCCCGVGNQIEAARRCQGNGKIRKNKKKTLGMGCKEKKRR